MLTCLYKYHKINSKLIIIFVNRMVFLKYCISMLENSLNFLNPIVMEVSFCKNSFCFVNVKLENKKGNTKAF